MKFARCVALLFFSFVASPDLLFAQTTVDVPGVHISTGDDGVVVSVPGVSVNAHAQGQPPAGVAAPVPQTTINALPVQTSNYQNSNLPGMDLSHRDLTGADFSNATLSGANFSGSILVGAKFGNATLTSVDFSNADLTRATLRNADLTGANLANTIFSGADLGNTTLDGAVVTGARFDGADLSNVDMDKVIRTVGAVPASQHQPVPPALQSTEKPLTESSHELNEPQRPVREEFIEKLGMAMAGTFFFTILLVLIVLLGGIILVIVRCIKNKDLSNPKKIAWVLLTFFFPPGSYIMMFFVEKKVKWKIVAVILFLMSAGMMYASFSILHLLPKPH